MPLTLSLMCALSQEAAHSSIRSYLLKGRMFLPFMLNNACDPQRMNQLHVIKYKPAQNPVLVFII